MLVALGWVALGIAVATGGWRMDRLAAMHIEPWSAPGLVPGVLGVLMTLFGALLAWREWRSARAPVVALGTPGPTGSTGSTGADGSNAASGADGGPGALRRVAPLLLLAVAWVFGALGRGLPFVATSATVVVAWIALLRWRDWRASGSIVRGLGVAVVIAVLACTAIAVLFEDVFLVRLP